MFGWALVIVLLIAGLLGSTIDHPQRRVLLTDTCEHRIENAADTREAMELGEAYVRGERPGGMPCASTAYQKAIAMADGTEERLWYEAGTVDLHAGRYTAAVYKLQKQRELFSDAVPEVHQALGEAYRARAGETDSIADLERAKVSFEERVALAPEDTQARADLAWTLFLTADHAAMERVLREGGVPEGDHTRLRYLYGLALLHVGKVDAANTYFGQSGEVPPGIQYVLSTPYPVSGKRGRGGEEEGRRKRCSRTIAHAIDPVALAGIGTYYFTGAEYDLWCASRAYEKAVQTKPDAVSTAWHQLGRTLFIQGRLTNAIRALETQEALFGEEFPPVYYMLGLTHAFMALDRERPGHWPTAEQYFRSFLTIKPVDPWGHTDLAWTLFSQEKYEEMREVTAQGLETHSHHPWLLNMHGLALMNLGELETAKAFLLAAKEEAGKLTSDAWGNAYPGNDARLYESGLKEFKSAIDTNLSLIADRIVNSQHD